MKKLSFVDNQGFVVTNFQMRNPDYPEIFAIGDAPSFTVPKLASLDHMKCEIAANVIANEAQNNGDHLL